MVSAKDAIVYSQGNEGNSIEYYISLIEAYIDAAISKGYSTCMVEINKGTPQSIRDKIKKELDLFGYFTFIPKYDPIKHYFSSKSKEKIIITWNEEVAERIKQSKQYVTGMQNDNIK